MPRELTRRRFVGSAAVAVAGLPVVPVDAEVQNNSGDSPDRVDASSS